MLSTHGRKRKAWFSPRWKNTSCKRQWNYWSN